MEMILGFEERVEKRDTLNVVPMIMRNQNMGFDAGVRLIPTIPEGSQACAAIENDMGSVWRGELEARRIAAVAPVFALGRRRRATDTPKDELG